jgi:hypothetical protein
MFLFMVFLKINIWMASIEIRSCRVEMNRIGVRLILVG